MGAGCAGEWVTCRRRRCRRRHGGCRSQQPTGRGALARTRGAARSAPRPTRRPPQPLQKQDGSGTHPLALIQGGVCGGPGRPGRRGAAGPQGALSAARRPNARAGRDSGVEGRGAANALAHVVPQPRQTTWGLRSRGRQSDASTRCVDTPRGIRVGAAAGRVGWASEAAWRPGATCVASELLQRRTHCRSALWQQNGAGATLRPSWEALAQCRPVLPGLTPRLGPQRRRCSCHSARLTAGAAARHAWSLPRNRAAVGTLTRRSLLPAYVVRPSNA